VILVGTEVVQLLPVPICVVATCSGDMICCWSAVKDRMFPGTVLNIYRVLGKK